MAHLNGPIDWRPVEEAPTDGTIIYGFFDPHTKDSGLHAHVRPVRRYSPNGDWFCGVSGRNLGYQGPVMFTERLPYPTRDQVRQVLQKALDKTTDDMVARHPEYAHHLRPTVPPLTF